MISISENRVMSLHFHGVCDDQVVFDDRVVRGPGLARGSFFAVFARG